MKKVIFSLFVLLSSFQLSAQPLVRKPSLSPDGQQIAFSYQGDIWTMSVDGGRAYRLTIHEGYDSKPIWSPDGQQIAFASDRYGNNDVFVMSATGGNPKQLTYYSGTDSPVSWTKKEGILFLTRRTHAAIERSYELYHVAPEGGTPQRLISGTTMDGQLAPGQKALAIVRGICRAERENYQGPANRDIWLYLPEKDAYQQVTVFKGQDHQPRWADANTLYYLSAASGKYNIHKVVFSDNYSKVSKPEKVTKYKDFGILDFQISADGKSLIFQRNNEILLLPTKGGKAKKINIEIATDYRFDPVQKKSFRNMEEYSISPNGKRVAYTVHGELFVCANNKDDNRAVRITKSSSRERNPCWLNDETLLYSSDQKGQYDLYAVSSKDSSQPDLFKSRKLLHRPLTNSSEDERNMLLAPDGKQIAFLRGRGELWVAAIDSAANITEEKQLLDGWATPSGLNWSPDSKWLAYSIDDLNFNEEIFIHAADNSKSPVNVSMHPRNDRNPVWSPDGSKLGFTSTRNNGDTDIWFVWLKEKDDLKSSAEWKNLDLDNKEKKSSKKKKTAKVTVDIDFDQIYNRARQVTSMPGSEYGMQFSKDGENIYYISRSNTGRNKETDVALYEVKWDGKENKELINGAKAPYALSLAADGKYLYMLLRGGKLSKMKLSNNKSEGINPLAKMEIDYKAELKQLFFEGWRALNAGFYDPNFHGKDWNKLRKTYEPLCMKASTKEDFQYMFNVMLGQLDASHMGMRGGSNPKSTQRNQSGLLGAEYQQSDKGLIIKNIVAASPASQSLKDGEIILSINGHQLQKEDNLYQFLEGQSDQQVLLEVLDQEGKKREVIIWPIARLSNLLYEEWVQERKKLTETYSNGRLGYIHIRAMGWSSFERFERELMAAGYGKEGIVIDVRYNGGGWTTDYLMTVLTVKQHAYTVPRGAVKNLEKENKQFSDYYPYGERLPLSAWTKASIALCNESSYSNAEIFSHAYKSLGIGTLVGKPTFGAVISTGAYGLIDGSSVRMPFRAWYVKESGLNMEHGPAVPDIDLELSPDYRSKGKDEQLQKSVDVLLEQLDASKFKK